MRQYQDNENAPSLLLLLAILLAGSKVCTDPQLMDPNDSTTSAARNFYKRAKALYDADYEDDRATIVQAPALMGWAWEDSEGKLGTMRHLAKFSTLSPPQMSLTRRTIGPESLSLSRRARASIEGQSFTSCLDIQLTYCSVERSQLSRLINACGNGSGGHYLRDINR